MEDIGENQGEAGYHPFAWSNEAPKSCLNENAESLWTAPAIRSQRAKIVRERGGRKPSSSSASANPRSRNRRLVLARLLRENREKPRPCRSFRGSRGCAATSDPNLRGSNFGAQEKGRELSERDTICIHCPAAEGGRALAKRSDRMIIVGGKNSSNSRS